MENKTYDILELQKMSTIELASLAETFSVSIQNNFKQGLIYEILDRQAEKARIPSELHARDRYALVAKFVIVAILSSILSMSVNAQKWEKATFRPAPRIGEITAVSGAIVMGASLYGAFGDETQFSKQMFVVGGAIAALGIYIDINSGKTKYKYKHKIKGKLFASSDRIGFRLKF